MICFNSSSVSNVERKSLIIPKLREKSNTSQVYLEKETEPMILILKKRDRENLSLSAKSRGMTFH
jgi:hypothetical protein